MFLFLPKVTVLLYACPTSTIMSDHNFVSVCTQHMSETGWTTVAGEGTGKESGGKGVTAAC